MFPYSQTYYKRLKLSIFDFIVVQEVPVKKESSLSMGGAKKFRYFLFTMWKLELFETANDRGKYVLRNVCVGGENGVRAVLSLIFLLKSL